MTKADVLTMDEVIVSSVSSEVTPVIDVDGNKIGAGVPGNGLVNYSKHSKRNYHFLLMQNK